MWKCPNCGRIFERIGQPHTCHVKPIEEHFRGKELAKEIFDTLFARINAEVGKSEIISIPCCIHLYGKYDYLAALPKKDRLEIRFALNRIIESPRLGQSVKVTKRSYKNCIDVRSVEEIDSEIIGWIKEAYHLKDTNKVIP